ncbi:MAG: hypothetical protein K1X94_00465 [Sandaracinaceae bacterium]|nr:hypothetical protein [Sandaracinaceae bacterium]
MHRRDIHRRDVLGLAVSSLVLGAMGPAGARADCAIPEERASWLATRVHAGARAFVWLGQPEGLPVPTSLDSSLGALPITWAVPGVAMITIAPSASGELVIHAPPRAARRTGDDLRITITPGAPTARLSAPPQHVRLETRTRPLHYDPAAEYVTAYFDAAPGARHLLARWGRVGSFVTLEAGASSAEIFAVGRCGNRPLDVPAPRRGETVELALLDEEGNLSAFVRTTA